MLPAMTATFAGSSGGAASEESKSCGKGEIVLVWVDCCVDDFVSDGNVGDDERELTVRSVEYDPVCSEEGEIVSSWTDWLELGEFCDAEVEILSDIVGVIGGGIVWDVVSDFVSCNEADSVSICEVDIDIGFEDEIDDEIVIGSVREWVGSLDGDREGDGVAWTESVNVDSREWEAESARDAEVDAVCS